MNVPPLNGACEPLLDYATGLSRARREVHATQEQAEAAIELSQEQGFRLQEAKAGTCRGWALVKQGRKDEGIIQIRQGLAAIHITAGELYTSA